MTIYYFGQAWDSPLFDRDLYDPDWMPPVQVMTPVGSPCYVCTTLIASGDRGELVSSETGVKYVHFECLMLHTTGHLWKVCGCTGFQRDREAALELLARMNGARALRGQGPL